MDPIAIAGALGSLTHLTNLVKSLGTVLKETGKAEALDKLIDLNSAILELQEKHAEMFAENQALKAENEMLKKHKDLRAQLLFKHGVYQLLAGAGYQYYCGNCLDSEGKYIRVTLRESGDGVNGRFFDCATCKTQFDANGIG